MLDSDQLLPRSKDRFKILISAAEASSDHHGAKLLEALRNELKDLGFSSEFFGIGGPQLKSVGLDIVVDARELLVMGFGEVLKQLPQILRSLLRLADAAKERKPDVIVVIDYPEFHFQLARKLKRSGIPLVFYIPPKVWIWRKRRLKFLRENFKKILCIFPFEELFYKNHGISAAFVGNPLLDELPLNLQKFKARQDLGFNMEDQILVMMPGSRSSELKHHIPIMLQACVLVAKELAQAGCVSLEKRLHVLVPFSLSSKPEEIFLNAEDGRIRNLHPFLKFHIYRGNSAQCMVAADAGMIKSGTSTLEAGILGCPHVIIYQTGRLSRWVFQNLIRYRGPVGLVNLMYLKDTDPANVHSFRIEEGVAKELVCENATPEAIAKEVVSLMKDPEKRERVQAGLRTLRERVLPKDIHVSPSQIAARQIISSFLKINKWS